MCISENMKSKFINLLTPATSGDVAGVNTSSSRTTCVLLPAAFSPSLRGLLAAERIVCTRFSYLFKCSY